MKFIKEHLFAIFALIVLAIILAGVGLAVYLLFYSEDSDPYNTRLTNIEQYPIDLKKVNEAKEKLFESGVVESVNYVLEGKLINFDIDVKRETKLAVAKEVASKVLESFTEEQLAFYDVHIIISNNAELKEVREIIGIKGSVAEQVKTETVFKDRYIVSIVGEWEAEKDSWSKEWDEARLRLLGARKKK